MFRWFEHRQVFVPMKKMVAHPGELGRPFEEARFASLDGTDLHGWFFPAGSEARAPARAMLLLHGNAGNISTRLNYYRAMLQTGVSVFAFDYRGFGQSAGRPSEDGTYLDAQSALRWLHQKGFSPSSIVALGESLGGGVASELAVRETLGGLVLYNTFTSIPDVGKEWFPWLPVRWLGSIQYNTHRKLPDIRTPVLIMHSRGDQLIRIQHAQANFQAAREPKLYWEIQGGHTDALETNQALFVQGLNQFLKLLDS